MAQAAVIGVAAVVLVAGAEEEAGAVVVAVPQAVVAPAAVGNKSFKKLLPLGAVISFFSLTSGVANKCKDFFARVQATYNKRANSNSCFFLSCNLR